MSLLILRELYQHLCLGDLNGHPADVWGNLESSSVENDNLFRNLEYCSTYEGVVTILVQCAELSVQPPVMNITPVIMNIIRCLYFRT